MESAKTISGDDFLSGISFRKTLPEVFVMVPNAFSLDLLNFLASLALELILFFFLKINFYFRECMSREWKGAKREKLKQTTH